MAALARRPRGAFVLIGFMGAGKSTVARRLAHELGVRARDSDALLEERLGHSLAEEFERAPVGAAVGAQGSAPATRPGGESAFRAKEEELVCELLARAQPGGVIALGGGSVLSERVRLALREHVVLLLDVEPEEAWRRVRSGGAERPLARDRRAFFALHAERAPLYERLADAHLRGLEPPGVARALGALTALALAPRGSRMLWASSASGTYPVLVGRGLLRALGTPVLARAWGLEGSRAFCVSDENVAELFGRGLDGLLGSIALAPGEASKTLASAERVWRAMVDAGVSRGDHVLALGGGVIGDLAGFCAAAYQRGIPVVHVPTTLLAQVDSAYGGKTGVDLPQAKNYIGAYHQPSGVLADPDALATLPAEELAAGWVEVLKTALIAGGELWERVAHSEQPDESMILACARLKLSVVAADERDAGQRQILNLGHTVGHAIEAASGYARYRHGEAVGLGLLAALRLSGREGLREQVRELLAARGLPVALDRQLDVSAVVQAIAHDKKRVREGVPFVLLRAPGDVRFGQLLPAEDVRAAVAELAQ
jgi:shikimate kinase/3-dehydroquinate synthase